MSDFAEPLCGGQGHGSTWLVHGLQLCDRTLIWGCWEGIFIGAIIAHNHLALSRGDFYTWIIWVSLI